MLAFALLASLNVVAADGPPRVLVLDLRAEDVPETTARLIRDEVAVTLSRGGKLDVLSTEDLRRVVSVEGEREAMGCDTDSSCLAEIGQAMGARFIVHGSIGQLGTTTIVQLNLFDTTESRAISRESAETTDQNQLLSVVRVALARVRLRMVGEEAKVETPEEPINTMVLVGGGLAAAGVTGLVIGGVMMAVVYPTFSNTTSPGAGGPSVAQRLEAQGTGQIGTIVATLGGLVAVGGGVALFMGMQE